MQNRLTDFFKPEDLEGKELVATSRRLLVMAVILFTASIAGIIVDGMIVGSTATIFILGPIALLLLVSIYLIQKKRFLLAQILLPFATMVAVLSLIARGNGLHDIVLLALPMPILVATMTLGTRGQSVFGLMVALGIALIGIGEVNGVITSSFSQYTGYSDILVIWIILMANAVLQGTSFRQLAESITQAKKNEQAQIKANQELRELQASLEDRISQRTLELEQRSHELADRTVQLELANIRTQRRAAQLQAISDVNRTISSVRTLSDLLPRIARVVGDRFGFFHVGIFLTDDAGQYAILSAANSEGGQKLLVNGHRIEIGGQSVIGYVTLTGSPYIVLETNTDEKFSRASELPETRSEITVPLKAERKIIGALDVHSNQINAFSQEDIEILSTLADQIAIAIENARLFESTQKSLSEVETIYRQYLQREWNRLSETGQVLGYQYSVTGAQPLESKVQAKEINRALTTGEITTKTGDEAVLAVPIKIRDEPIGILNIRIPGKQFWKQDEIVIARAIADRVAISAENARLFEESQQRATKEQIIGEITSKIGASVNMKSIMQTAVEELGHVLAGSEVSIQIKK